MHMTTVCMHMTTMRALLLHFWARDDTGPAVSDFVSLWGQIPTSSGILAVLTAVSDRAEAEPTAKAKAKAVPVPEHKIGQTLSRFCCRLRR